MIFDIRIHQNENISMQIVISQSLSINTHKKSVGIGSNLKLKPVRQQPNNETMQNILIRISGIKHFRNNYRIPL